MGVGKTELLERKLVQVAPVPRSVFEQTPMGHELLSSRLDLAGAISRGRAGFGMAGQAQQPRWVICAWVRGETPHRAKLKSELCCSDTNRDGRNTEEGGRESLAWFVLVGEHGAGDGEFAESTTLPAWKKNCSCPCQHFTQIQDTVLRNAPTYVSKKANVCGFASGTSRQLVQH